GSYGLPSVAVVGLWSLMEGGPAEAQGLRVYDVIVELDGQPIERSGQLQQAIAMKRPGDRVSVGVYRDGRRVNVTVQLDEADLQGTREVVAATLPVPDPRRMNDKLGLRIEDMDRTSAREYGYEEVDGVVITDVVVNGPAARRGVAPGWKILEINREPVRRRSDVDRIMANVDPGGIVTLHVAAPNDNRQIFHIRVSR
ncbi:MAG: PDZ domain-containing protein, partial [Gemmatimonadetes bacterium]|nr:PDZ domain-containing protein [Gemmatimonadota bacterium]